jgi:hypothetical protein
MAAATIPTATNVGGDAGSNAYWPHAASPTSCAAGVGYEPPLGLDGSPTIAVSGRSQADLHA